MICSRCGENVGRLPVVHWCPATMGSIQITPAVPVDRLKVTDKTFFGFPVVEDGALPPGEIRFVSPEGKVLGVITGLDFTGNPRS
jgi:hypothetical protein